ncbi:tetratricopeptide repeat protein [Nordella sp. HKS 07]|uniref:BTAD domain-containing putative transcriptional regulator n=1 Tax=Nordella sp. HKS 07 TaxID=2712222 RepID=UPI0013E166B0|nr:BTAD domain-containing putative transcriptional regulator [Nordella sp. HKS 07]QIG47585.1 tetratricopeptide repeat protein [Nordella sp. HKS 07]
MGGGRELKVVVNVNTVQNQGLRSPAGATGLRIRIRLLGPISITSDGGPIAIPSKKARALIGYLVLREGTAIARTSLTGMLWGERSEDQARASLRQTLSELRGALEDTAQHLIIATKETLAWVPGSAWIDAKVLEAAATSKDDGALREAAELVVGDLMEGLSVGEASFEQWLVTERERFRLLACTVYAQLVERTEHSGKLEEALFFGLKLLSLDPLQEHVHRTLMRLYAAQGRHDAALAQFERCKTVLAEELSAMPDSETEGLAKALRSRRRAATVPAVNRMAERLALPDRPSIAVLPFTPIGADQESGYFAEGVADDITTELSRNRDLFVVARHSSFRVAQDNSDPAAIGNILGVRHILTGSVRRAYDRLRLSVHLIRCATGDEAWAERYDREIGDLFALQLDIARIVTATIAGRLTALAEAASAAKAPENFDAYDHVLRAQHYLQRYTRADYAIARRHLERAIEADPSYARPYSLLCLAGVYDWFWDMAEGGLTIVLAKGEKALSLDDHDAKAHLALGITQLFSYNHDRAIYHFERAVTLNPNDDLIAAEHGRLLMYLDRPADGLDRVREARRLNPFHPNWYWNLEGRCLHTEGRYEEAIAAFDRIDVPQFWTEAYLAACHAMCGRSERAAHHVARLREMRPDFRLAIFKGILPYQNKATLERFLDTFRKAGITD